MAVDIILHCSDSGYGNAALITKWHLERGFDTIGYHYVILNGQLDTRHYNNLFDGQIESGRPLDDDHTFEISEQGAHVRGHNRSVGVCLVGKSGDFTDKQISSLIWLLGQLKEQFIDVTLSQHSNYDRSKWFCAGIADLDSYRETLNISNIKA